MRKGLIILFTLIAFIAQAQDGVNPDGSRYIYTNVAEAVKTKMVENQKFAATLESGDIANFTVKLRSKGYTPNGGTIRAMKDSLSVMVMETSQAQAVNVKWFGAKGDGSTDDWDAINRAISSLPAYPSFNAGTFSGTVYFPGGTYRLSKPIVLQRAVGLLGESGFIQESTRLLFNNGIDGIIAAAPIAADAQHAAVGSAQGFSVENMAIIQDIGTKSIGHGLWMHVRGTVKETTLSNWAGDGIRVEANGTASSFYNKVILASIAQPGSYSDSTAPTVTFVPVNGGSGAVAHAVLGGKITGVTLLDPGAHYTARPYTKIETTRALDRNTMHTDGWGAWCDPTLQMDTVVITNGGSGYTHATVQFVGLARDTAEGAIQDSAQLVADTLNIADTLPGAGTVQIVGGQIVGVTITNKGEYVYMPKVVITGDGTGATAKAYASIKKLYFNDILGGSWYEPRDTPTVYVYGGHEENDPLARDASIKVSTFGKFQLKRIEIDNMGDGYYEEPLVTLSGGHSVTQGTVRAETGRQRQGNANQFLIDKVRSVLNSNGLVVAGGDANAGNINGSDFSYNKQMGIWEASFLGNTYSGGHSTANYVAPIYAISATGFNTFLNYYDEGNQPPIIALSPSVFIGGDNGAKTIQKPGAPAIMRDVQKVNTGMIIQTEGTGYFQTGGLFDNPGAGTIMRWGGSSLASSYQFKQALIGSGAGDMLMLYGGDEFHNGIMKITGVKTVQKFGRDSTVPHAVAIHRLMLGSTGSTYNSYRMLTYSNGVPSSLPIGVKQWAIGDFVFNSVPNATTGVMGWHRLTKGTGNVLGTDWLAMAAGIQNQSAVAQVGSFYIAGKSIISNSSVTIDPVNIPNSALTLVARNADPYHNLLNIMADGAASGGHFGTFATNTVYMNTGAYYSQSAGGVRGGIMPLETTAASYTQQAGKHYFMNATGLTPGVASSLNYDAILDENGFSLNGANPNARFNLRANSTTYPSIQFDLAGAVAKTTPVRGGLEAVSNYLLYTDSTGTRDTIARRSWVRSVMPIAYWQRASTTVRLLNAGDNLTVDGKTKIGVVPSGTTSLNAVVYDPADSTLKQVAFPTGSGGSYAGPIITKVASNITNSAVTESDVTGLTAGVLANSVYYFTADIQVTTTGTGGVKFQLLVPTGTTYNISAFGNTTTTATTGWAVYNGNGTTEVGTFATAAFSGGSAIAMVHMTGQISTNSTAGAIQLQFRSGTAGETKTVLAGSAMKIEQGAALQ